MYIPTSYNETEWKPKEELIKANPLGTIITYDENGLQANHIPFHLIVDESTGKKMLHAHVSKTNPQLSAWRKDSEVLVIFKSADSYITPSYYPTKKETHKVVPTWDFAAVHCYGKATVIDDTKWVRKQLDDLSDQQEKELENPWKVDDAPANYVSIKQKAIIGLQIELARTEAKFKFEQGMKSHDVKGVIDGLAKHGKHEVSAYVQKCNATV